MLRDQFEGVLAEFSDAVKQYIALDDDSCATIAIDEEIVRLRAHTASMRAYMEQDEPLGRKLEFILQEINREINTIGSKAMNADIQASVITVKGELEKLREQIQNVE